MEELAAGERLRHAIWNISGEGAGLSLFSANEAPELQSLVAHDPAQTWCEQVVVALLGQQADWLVMQRLDHAVQQLNKGSSAPCEHKPLAALD